MKRPIVVIAHAAFDPDRAAPLARLVAQLEAQGVSPVIFKSEVREHARIWAMRVWRNVAALGSPDAPDDAQSTPVVILNDDVEVPDEFVEAICEVVRVARAHADAYGQRSVAPISLHVQHPAARELGQRGEAFARSYSYTGPGVVLTPALARSLVEWADAHPDAWRTQNEDGVANAWAWDRQIPFLTTIPALVKHDTRVPSTLGYDGHAMRTSSVPYDDPAVVHPRDLTSWTTRTAPEWLPHPWMTEGTMRALCAKRAPSSPSASDAKKARVCLASVSRGNPAPEYTESLTALVHVAATDPAALFELHPQRFNRNDCIVHARSAIVRDFLDTECTHLFLVDDDHAFRPIVLQKMIESGHDFVAAPYPRREGVDFVRVAGMGGLYPSPEAAAYRYSVTLANDEETIDPSKLDEHHCVEIEAIGMGCVLLARSVVERMVAQYDRELGYRDPRAGMRRTVALFQLVFQNIPITTGELVRETPQVQIARLEEIVEQVTNGADRIVIDGDASAVLAAALREIKAWRSGELPHIPRNRILLGEDTSFCKRWRNMGGTIRMYLGAGSPIDHVGRLVYRGHVEPFGLTRAPVEQEEIDLVNEATAKEIDERGRR